MDLHTWMLNDLAGVRAKLTDGVLGRVPADRWHEQSDGGGSSITHLVLHLTRHQDLAVNSAVRDQSPLFVAHRSALGLANMPMWAGLGEREDTDVTTKVSPEALGTYLDEVFDSTAVWLDALGSMVLDTVVDTSRRLRDRAALPPAQLDWLHRMWADKPVWWFLQWPVIGHGHTHVGEATGVRNRLGFSPF
ncbi:MAG: DinB family protein [Ilumatobacteraceae bacterium]